MTAASSARRKPCISLQTIPARRHKNFFLDRYAEAYRREMDHFADMLDGAEASVGYADGVNALALAEAAAESVRTGAPVRF